MPRNPQGRLTDDGIQPQTPFGFVPEEVAGPGEKQNTADADWLSMATADPALFLKEVGTE